MQKHILEMMLGAPEKTATGAMKAMFAPGVWKDDVFNQPVLGLYEDGSTSLKNDSVKKRFPKLEYHEISAMPVVSNGIVKGMISSDLLARKSLLSLLQSQI